MAGRGSGTVGTSMTSDTDGEGSSPRLTQEQPYRTLCKATQMPSIKLQQTDGAQGLSKGTQMPSIRVRQQASAAGSSTRSSSSTRQQPATDTTTHGSARTSTTGSSEQPAILSAAKLRNHRLWRERVSAASPHERAHQDVVAALHSSLQAAAKNSSQGFGASDQYVGMSTRQAPRRPADKSPAAVKNLSATRHSGSLPSSDTIAVGADQDNELMPAEPAIRTQPSLRQLRSHRLWQGRASAATPAARLATRVDQTLHDLWRDSAANDGNEQSHSAGQLLQASLATGTRASRRGHGVNSPSQQQQRDGKSMQAPAEGSPLKAHAEPQLGTQKHVARHAHPARPAAAAAAAAAANKPLWTGEADRPTVAPAAAVGGMGMAEQDTDSHSTSSDRSESTQGAGSSRPLQQHRLWRERQSHASPEARAAARIQDVLSSWMPPQASDSNPERPRGAPVALEAAFHQAYMQGPGIPCQSPSKLVKVSKQQAAKKCRVPGVQQRQCQELADGDQSTAASQATGSSYGDEAGAHLQQLQQHRLWKERQSSASPDARAAAHVHGLLADWADQQDFGATITTAVLQARDTTAIPTSYTATIEPADCNVVGARHKPSLSAQKPPLPRSVTKPASTQRQAAARMLAQDMAVQGMPQQQLQLQEGSVGAHTNHPTVLQHMDSGRSSSHGSEVAADVQQLQQHRLWRERQSCASPEARAAARVQDVLSSWAASQAFNSDQPFAIVLGDSMNTPLRPQDAEQQTSLPRMQQVASYMATQNKDTYAGPQQLAPGQVAKQSPVAQGVVAQQHSSAAEEAALVGPVAQQQDNSSRSTEAGADIRQLQQHRLWQQRQSAASPEARAAAHVQDVLSGWVQANAHSAPAGNTTIYPQAATASHAVAGTPAPVPHQVPQQVLQQGQLQLNQSSQPPPSGWNTGNRHHTTAAPAQHQPPLLQSSSQQHAMLADVYTMSGEAMTQLQAASERSSKTGADPQHLRQHRLWKERPSFASPEARAAAALQNALSGWLENHNDDHTLRGITANIPLQIGGDIIQSHGKAQQQVAEQVQQQRSASPPVRRNLPEEPIQQPTAQPTAVTGHVMTARPQTASPYISTPQVHGNMQQPSLQHQLSKVSSSRSSEYGTDLQQLQEHRLWKARQSSANPDARAAAHVQDVLHSWAMGQHVSNKQSALAAGSIMPAEKELSAVHGAPIMQLSSAAKQLAWEHAAQTPLDASCQQQQAAAYMAVSNDQQQRQRSTLEGLGSNSRPAVQKQLSSHASSEAGVDVQQLQQHRLWKERQSSASPDAHAAARVQDVLAGWCGSNPETGSTQVTAPVPATARAGNACSPPQEITLGDPALHAIMQAAPQQAAAVCGPKVSRQQPAIAATPMPATGPHMHRSATPAVNVSQPLPQKSRDSRDSSSSGAGVDLQLLQQHRLWKERESSASPKARAAACVQETLSAWVGRDDLSSAVPTSPAERVMPNMTSNSQAVLDMHATDVLSAQHVQHAQHGNMMVQPVQHAMTMPQSGILTQPYEQHQSVHLQQHSRTQGNPGEAVRQQTSMRTIGHQATTDTADDVQRHSLVTPASSSDGGMHHSVATPVHVVDISAAQNTNSCTQPYASVVLPAAQTWSAEAAGKVPSIQHAPEGAVTPVVQRGTGGSAANVSTPGSQQLKSPVSEPGTSLMGVAVQAGVDVQLGRLYTLALGTQGQLLLQPVLPPYSPSAPPYVHLNTPTASHTPTPRGMSAAGAQAVAAQQALTTALVQPAGCADASVLVSGLVEPGITSATQCDVHSCVPVTPAVTSLDSGTENASPLEHQHERAKERMQSEQYQEQQQAETQEQEEGQQQAKEQGDGWDVAGTENITSSSSYQIPCINGTVEMPTSALFPLQEHLVPPTNVGPRAQGKSESLLQVPCDAQQQSEEQQQQRLLLPSPQLHLQYDERRQQQQQQHLELDHGITDGGLLAEHQENHDIQQWLQGQLPGDHEHMDQSLHHEDKEAPEEVQLAPTGSHLLSLQQQQLPPPDDVNKLHLPIHLPEGHLSAEQPSLQDTMPVLQLAGASSTPSNKQQLLAAKQEPMLDLAMPVHGVTQLVQEPADAGSLPLSAPLTPAAPVAGAAYTQQDSDPGESTHSASPSDQLSRHSSVPDDATFPVPMQSAAGDAGEAQNGNALTLNNNMGFQPIMHSSGLHQLSALSNSMAELYPGSNISLDAGKAQTLLSEAIPSLQRQTQADAFTATAAIAAREAAQQEQVLATHALTELGRTAAQHRDAFDADAAPLTGPLLLPDPEDELTHVLARHRPSSSLLPVLQGETCLSDSRCLKANLPGSMLQAECTVSADVDEEPSSPRLDYLPIINITEQLQHVMNRLRHQLPSPSNSYTSTPSHSPAAAKIRSHSCSPGRHTPTLHTSMQGPVSPWVQDMLAAAAGRSSPAVAMGLLPTHAAQQSAHATHTFTRSQTPHSPMQPTPAGATAGVAVSSSTQARRMLEECQGRDYTWLDDEDVALLASLGSRDPGSAQVMAGSSAVLASREPAVAASSDFHSLQQGGTSSQALAPSTEQKAASSSVEQEAALPSDSNDDDYHRTPSQVAADLEGTLKHLTQVFQYSNDTTRQAQQDVGGSDGAARRLQQQHSSRGQLAGIMMAIPPVRSPSRKAAGTQVPAVAAAAATRSDEASIRVQPAASMAVASSVFDASPKQVPQGMPAVHTRQNGQAEPAAVPNLTLASLSTFMAYRASVTPSMQPLISPRLHDEHHVFKPITSELSHSQHTGMLPIAQGVRVPGGGLQPADKQAPPGAVTPAQSAALHKLAGSSSTCKQQGTQAVCAEQDDALTSILTTLHTLDHARAADGSGPADGIAVVAMVPMPSSRAQPAAAAAAASGPNAGDACILGTTLSQATGLQASTASSMQPATGSARIQAGVTHQAAATRQVEVSGRLSSQAPTVASAQPTAVPAHLGSTHGATRDIQHAAHRQPVIPPRHLHLNVHKLESPPSDMANAAAAAATLRSATPQPPAIPAPVAAQPAPPLSHHSLPHTISSDYAAQPVPQLSAVPPAVALTIDNVPAMMIKASHVVSPLKLGAVLQPIKSTAGRRRSQDTPRPAGSTTGTSGSHTKTLATAAREQHQSAAITSSLPHADVQASYVQQAAVVWPMATALLQSSCPAQQALQVAAQQQQPDGVQCTFHTATDSAVISAKPESCSDSDCSRLNGICDTRHIAPDFSLPGRVSKEELCTTPAEQITRQGPRLYQASIDVPTDAAGGLQALLSAAKGTAHAVESFGVLRSCESLLQWALDHEPGLAALDARLRVTSHVHTDLTLHASALPRQDMQAHMLDNAESRSDSGSHSTVTSPHPVMCSPPSDAYCTAAASWAPELMSQHLQQLQRLQQSVVFTSPLSADPHATACHGQLVPATSQQQQVLCTPPATQQLLRDALVAAREVLERPRASKSASSASSVARNSRLSAAHSTPSHSCQSDASSLTSVRGGSVGRQYNACEQLEQQSAIVGQLDCSDDACMQLWNNPAFSEACSAPATLPASPASVTGRLFNAAAPAQHPQSLVLEETELHAAQEGAAAAVAAAAVHTVGWAAYSGSRYDSVQDSIIAAQDDAGPLALQARDAKQDANLLLQYAAPTPQQAAAHQRRASTEQAAKRPKRAATESASASTADAAMAGLRTPASISLRDHVAARPKSFSQAAPATDHAGHVAALKLLSAPNVVEHSAQWPVGPQQAVDNAEYGDIGVDAGVAVAAVAVAHGPNRTAPSLGSNGKATNELQMLVAHADEQAQLKAMHAAYQRVGPSAAQVPTGLTQYDYGNLAGRAAIRLSHGSASELATASGARTDVARLSTIVGKVTCTLLPEEPSYDLSPIPRVSLHHRGSALTATRMQTNAQQGVDSWATGRHSLPTQHIAQQSTCCSAVRQGEHGISSITALPCEADAFTMNSRGGSVLVEASAFGMPTGANAALQHAGRSMPALSLGMGQESVQESVARQSMTQLLQKLSSMQRTTRQVLSGGFKQQQ